MLDILTRIVIPILTFGLGIYATFWFQRRTAQNAVRRENLARVSQLCAQWYAQIRSVVVMNLNENGEARLNRQHDYLRSREILPNLIECVATLRHIGRDKELLSAIEEFLAALTTNDSSSIRDALQCPNSTIQCSLESDTFLELPQIDTKEKRYQFVADVDRRLQNVNRMAGQSLAR